MASRLFAKLSRIRSIAPVNPKTSVPRCSAYAYRKHTLGSYPAIDLKSARGLAGKALRAVAEGRDLGREKMQERTAKPDTVEAVARQFVERHCKRSNRPRTARETQRLLDLHVLPRWRGRLVRDIIRRDVLDLLDRVVDGGKPIAANRTLAAIRKMFNWAVARDIIAASPCAGVRPPTAGVDPQAKDNKGQVGRKVRGLRRLRAAQLLGWTKIPVHVVICTMWCAANTLRTRTANRSRRASWSQ